MEVVECEHTDINLLVPLVRQWISAGNVQAFGFEASETIMTHTIRRMIASDSACVIALFDGVRFVGFMGGVLISNHFTNNLIVNECFWYVLPDFRAYAKRLFKTLRLWGKVKGCSHIIINASAAANVKSDRVCQLLKLWGLKHYESSFIGAL